MDDHKSTVTTVGDVAVERVISSAGDPFFAAAPRLAEMTPSQRDKILREHYAKEYREHLRRIMAMGCDEPGDGDGEEG